MRVTLNYNKQKLPLVTLARHRSWSNYDGWLGNWLEKYPIYYCITIIIMDDCCSKEVEWMECHFTTIYGSGVKFPRREHDRVNQHLSGACNYICTYISKLQTPAPAPKWLVGRPSRKNSWPKVHSHNMYTQSFNSDVLFFVSSIVDHQPPTTSTTPSIRPSVQEANYPNITSEDWNVVSIKLFRPE